MEATRDIWDDTSKSATFTFNPPNNKGFCMGWGMRNKRFPIKSQYVSTSPNRLDDNARKRTPYFFARCVRGKGEIQKYLAIKKKSRFPR